MHRLPRDVFHSETASKGVLFFLAVLKMLQYCACVQYALTAHQWLAEACSLWAQRGVDWVSGGFFEALSLEGKPVLTSRRAMVQARQIYSFKKAYELGFCEKEIAVRAVEAGCRFLIEKYSLPTGAFIHSVRIDLTPDHLTPDLYTQAFALFGLGHAYAFTGQPELKSRAIALLNYLIKERQVLGGGFTETSPMGPLYRSNPHMHLFEAAIVWMACDPDLLWKELADKILKLCLDLFIDEETGFLGEYFDEGWSPQFENGKFVFEPGHQYEWAWLMGKYQSLTGKNLGPDRERLFSQSEKYGIFAERGCVFDEVWSDGIPKSKSSRFWPQCERIKAAVQLSDEASKEKYLKAAEQALGVLFKYFDTPIRGLWFDRWEESGEFPTQPAKASSFYHIIGAISEYLRISS